MNDKTSGKDGGAGLAHIADKMERSQFGIALSTAEINAIIAALRAAQKSPDPAREGVFNFMAHLQRQREWSERTFGPGERAQGVIDHIRKELREVEDDPLELSEWIDVTILALDGAWRAGYSPSEIIHALVAKQTKNESRKWPDWRTAEPGKAIEHIKETAPAPTPPSGIERRKGQRRQRADSKWSINQRGTDRRKPGKDQPWTGSVETCEHGHVTPHCAICGKVAEPPQESAGKGSDARKWTLCPLANCSIDEKCSKPHFCYSKAPPPPPRVAAITLPDEPDWARCEPFQYSQIVMSYCGNLRNTAAAAIEQLKVITTDLAVAEKCGTSCLLERNQAREQCTFNRMRYEAAESERDAARSGLREQLQGNAELNEQLSAAIKRNNDLMLEHSQWLSMKSLIIENAELTRERDRLQADNATLRRLIADATANPRELGRKG